MGVGEEVLLKGSGWSALDDSATCWFNLAFYLAQALAPGTGLLSIDSTSTASKYWLRSNHPFCCGG